jgi:hypothetical protein
MDLNKNEKKIISTIENLISNSTKDYTTLNKIKSCLLRERDLDAVSFNFEGSLGQVDLILKNLKRKNLIVFLEEKGRNISIKMA